MKHRLLKQTVGALTLAILLTASACAETAATDGRAEAMPTLPPAQVLISTATPEPTPAPPEAASIEDDGMLRVELRSLEGQRQLHLTLSGVYAVDGDPGFRFDRDARVTLSAANGSVYLAVGGLTIDMGQSVALTRHRAGEGEPNGIVIDEAGETALYCGDLTVAAEGNALRAVLKIQVEDYLVGVVAYEMSDSFPIEALKAQAVAARTYALQRKWQSGGRDYDVVDTTADQVFKGYDPQYANVIAAVADTRGAVGLYGGGFAVCYYTASNGGQTALASQIWGRADSDGYLAMRDDPYDVENPRSLQNELTFTARCEGSAALKDMLEAALGEQMAALGYGEGEWMFDSIADIEPVNPRFEGSYMYDGVRFELRAKLLQPVATPEQTTSPAPEAAGGEATEAPATETEAPSAEPTASATPQPTEVPREWALSEQTYAVTLDTYAQIKDGLSLGLNSADYELVSVQRHDGGAGEAEAFTLVMRRFGHGVGMSQRGAQWMAGHYGKTWQEILAFYYPGLSVQVIDWPDATPSDLDALPDSVGAARPKPTPTPSPAPLPAPEAGERYATVTATMLNVRERPTTASFAIDRLPEGRRILVCTEPDEDGWVRIRTAELDGYVKAEYLNME